MTLKTTHPRGVPPIQHQFSMAALDEVAGEVPETSKPWDLKARKGVGCHVSPKKQGLNTLDGRNPAWLKPYK